MGAGAVFQLGHVRALLGDLRRGSEQAGALPQKPAAKWGELPPPVPPPPEPAAEEAAPTDEAADAAAAVAAVAAAQAGEAMAKLAHLVGA